MACLLILQVAIPQKVEKGGPNFLKETIGLELNTESHTMRDLPNYSEFYRNFFNQFKANDSYIIGVVTNGSDFASEVADYLYIQFMQVRRFTTSQEMMAFAAKTIKDDYKKQSNLTAGLSFVSQGDGGEYKYTLYMDEDFIQDISSNFVDPLQT